MFTGTYQFDQDCEGTPNGGPQILDVAYINSCGHFQQVHATRRGVNGPSTGSNAIHADGRSALKQTPRTSPTPMTTPLTAPEREDDKDDYSDGDSGKGPAPKADLLEEGQSGESKPVEELDF